MMLRNRPARANSDHERERTRSKQRTYDSILALTPRALVRFNGGAIRYFRHHLGRIKILLRATVSRRTLDDRG